MNFRLLFKRPKVHWNYETRIYCQKLRILSWPTFGSELGHLIGHLIFDVILVPKVKCKLCITLSVINFVFWWNLKFKFPYMVNCQKLSKDWLTYPDVNERAIHSENFGVLHFGVLYIVFIIVSFKKILPNMVLIFL